jgi:hypothetical protein
MRFFVVLKPLALLFADFFVGVTVRRIILVGDSSHIPFFARKLIDYNVIAFFFRVICMVFPNSTLVMTNKHKKYDRLYSQYFKNIEYTEPSEVYGFEIPCNDVPRKVFDGDIDLVGAFCTLVKLFKVPTDLQLAVDLDSKFLSSNRYKFDKFVIENGENYYHYHYFNGKVYKHKHSHNYVHTHFTTTGMVETDETPDFIATHIVDMSAFDMNRVYRDGNKVFYNDILVITNPDEVGDEIVKMFVKFAQGIKTHRLSKVRKHSPVYSDLGPDDYPFAYYPDPLLPRIESKYSYFPGGMIDTSILTLYQNSNKKKLDSDKTNDVTIDKIEQS